MLMAIAGNYYTIQLGPSHLGWGNHRYTNTRDIIYGEGYIPLPKRYARSFNIYNSNNPITGLSYNLFRASSVDGFLNNVPLLAQGCSTAGDVYAKQFSVQGDLTMIGAWYASQNVTTNNSVRVTWTSPTDILLEII
ncbi:MAG TPA: hypothetical protein DCR69_07595 [Clostridium sp.]|nr:hypothetical protein [Clostridium sp.]